MVEHFTTHTPCVQTPTQPKKELKEKGRGRGEKRGGVGTEEGEGIRSCVLTLKALMPFPHDQVYFFQKQAALR